MIKRIIRETVREYGADGEVVKEIITETTEDDDTVYFPSYGQFPYPTQPTPTTSPWWGNVFYNCENNKTYAQL